MLQSSTSDLSLAFNFVGLKVLPDMALQTRNNVPLLTQTSWGSCKILTCPIKILFDLNCFIYIQVYPITLTDLDSSGPRSLLKTTPPLPGYPWVSGGRYVTPEPRFSVLVLDHQGLEELELKNHPKTVVFWQFFGSGSFKSW